MAVHFCKKTNQVEPGPLCDFCLAHHRPAMVRFHLRAAEAYWNVADYENAEAAYKMAGVIRTGFPRKGGQS